MKPCIFFAEEYMCAFLLGAICSPFYVYPFPDINARIGLREGLHALCKTYRSEISFFNLLLFTSYLLLLHYIVNLEVNFLSSSVQSMPSDHQSQCSILSSMLQYLYHNTLAFDWLLMSIWLYIMLYYIFFIYIMYC